MLRWWLWSIVYLNRPKPQERHENSLFLMSKMMSGVRHSPPWFAVLLDAKRRKDLWTFAACVRQKAGTGDAEDLDKRVSIRFIQLSRCQNTHHLSDVPHLFVRDEP
jgi:hypothetical protein